MSQKKIIFFVIIGIIILAIIGWIFALWNQKKTVVSSANLTIWINEWTTEEFNKLIDWFHAASKDNAKIQIQVEKKTSDTDKYRTLLLQTLADWVGPDIFMLQKGEDKTLEWRLLTIPGSYIGVSDFENRFDDSFRGLVVTDTSKKPNEDGLLWVPVGFETLGVFYNRSLMRSGVPKSWQEIENLYGQFPTGKYPTNLWLESKFTPNLVDVLSAFFLKENILSYTGLTNMVTPWQSYYSYGDLTVGNTEVTDTTYTSSDTLRRNSQTLIQKKYTTFDEFMRGNIGLIIWYPSIITELEKSKKRVGSENVSDVILTESIPQFSDKNLKNIAKYSYLGISKNTNKADAAARFLSYLSTPDAERILMEIYPYMIPAQKEFQASAQGKSLSPEIPRAKIDPFIPKIAESIQVFDFGIKSKFQSILDNNWSSFDSRESLSQIGNIISKNITCEMSLYENTKWASECEKNQ